MRQFRLVDRDDHRQEAHANARNQASDVQHRDDHAGSLDHASDNEDAARHKDGPTTAERVRE